MHDCLPSRERAFGSFVSLSLFLLLFWDVYSPRDTVSLIESCFVTVQVLGQGGDSEDGSPLTLPLDLQSRLARAAFCPAGLRNGVKK